MNKNLSENRRGLAHFAESSEQNVPVPLSSASEGLRMGSKTLIRSSLLVLASLAIVSGSGCAISEWFASKPRRDTTVPRTDEFPERNTGYLAGGPTFSNVHSAYQQGETATERAIRLRAANEKLHAAIAERERDLADWQQRYEAKEQLLKRVEAELRSAVADVKTSSQQLDAWQDELSKLYAKTRNETEASAEAFESLSRQVEALLRKTSRETSTPGGSMERHDSRPPAANAPESILPPPAAAPSENRAR